ncbi:MAG TPA: hypothetical protein VMU69_07395, partial [Bradyrhizobium sp.]|nr:hypothetical protein [Bradyrhizobium sp.]
GQIGSIIATERSVAVRRICAAWAYPDAAAKAAGLRARKVRLQPRSQFLYLYRHQMRSTLECQIVAIDGFFFRHRYGQLVIVCSRKGAAILPGIGTAQSQDTF